LRHLGGLAFGVDHYLGVAAGVDGQAQDPASVLEAGATVEQLFVPAEVYLLGVGVEDQGGLELVQLLVGDYALPSAGEFSDEGVGVVELRGRVGVSRFEVLLTVKAGSFDEGVTPFS
jgi:hypothetical protein